MRTDRACGMIEAVQPDNARGEVVVVEAAAAGMRLDKWLAAPGRLGSRRRAIDALAHGRVWVEGVEQTEAAGARRLSGGEAIRIWLDRPGSAARRSSRRPGPLDILFEDADVLVIAKPAGILTVPLPAQPDAPSLADAVAEYWRSHGKRRPLAVHRLDRDTSGPVVFARTAVAQERLKDQFAARRPTRIYLAIVHGHPAPAEGTWRTWLTWDPRARVQRPAKPHTPRTFEAVAHYRTNETWRAHALVEVRLVTGKRHQIRAQAWLAGCPLVGERIYTGPPAPIVAERPFPRQALHGWRLEFLHPRTREALSFEVPPPADFEALLASLRES